MELHSYAKRKAAKKWTIEQKRKLVEARITYDSIFSKKPLNCLITWKKVVSLAKLEDFNVSFVRKQWANMVVKYKQYKRSRLGSTTTNAVDDELVRKISQEWEFFYAIHTFMSRKITNLHSYALTEGQKQKQSTSNVLTQQQQQEQDENNASLASQLEKMLAHNNGSSPEIEPAQNIATFSSDTNEDYAAAAEIIASETIKAAAQPPDDEPAAFISAERAGKAPADSDDADMLSIQQTQNTDHDFYSRKSPKQKHYFSDDDTDIEAEQKKQQLKQNIDADIAIQNDNNNTPQTEGKLKVDANLNQTSKAKSTAKKTTTNVDEKVQNLNNLNNLEITAGTSRSRENNHAAAKAKTARPEIRQKPKLSERDKYYRHKRRFNRRLERRFDKLLNVFGQIVKAEYPSIDVHPLLGAAAGSTTVGTGLKFPDQDEENLNGNHLGDALSSSGASSTEDVEMSSSNYDHGDDDDDDDVDDDDEHAESQMKTAAGKKRDCEKKIQL